MARIFYADLFGPRKDKYNSLLENDLSTTSWTELSPQSPHYLFVPQNVDLLGEYEQGWKISEVMQTHSMGITTGRDAFATAYTVEELEQRISNLAGNEGDAHIRNLYGLQDSSSFSLNSARQWARTSTAHPSITQMAYRCFDLRYMMYSAMILARPRQVITSHQVHEGNYSLITFRAIREQLWEHVFTAAYPIAKEYVSSLDNCFAFPLYLYSNTDPRKQTLFDSDEPNTAPGGRRPNLNPAFIADIEQRLGMTFVPDGRGNLGVGIVDASEDAGGTHIARTAAVSAAKQLDVRVASEDGGGTGSEGSTRTASVPAAWSQPNDEIKARDRGRLPHWEMNNAIYFVTFRLADSLPQNVLRAIDEERANIVRKARDEGHQLSDAERDRLAQLTTDKIEDYLDAGVGECYLANPQIAEMVANTLRYFDGTRYRLFAWCVMPNHVHVVFRPFPGQSLADILHSWKSFSAKQVNKILNREGTVWQREYYDHLIREEEEFGRIIEYIAGNPAEAGLQKWRWVEVLTADLDSPDNAAETAAVQTAPHVPPASSLAINTLEQTAAVSAAVRGTFGPEDVFNYMYAIFHSPTYRSRYAEFLKIDFPRLSLTSDPALFRTLCGLGEQLVGLHLMESHPPTTVSFPVRGDNKVEKVQYTAPTGSEPGRVHINKTQYFENVPPEAWEFHIGGYQVAEKWLKDRKGRTLTLDDMQHYQGIIAALLATGRIMGEIDAAIPTWPLQ